MPASPSPSMHVLKLGGSLLDDPRWPVQLETYAHQAKITRGLIVVGGGQGANQVRRYDAQFHLGQETSHWLAIRAMQFNAHCVAGVLRVGDLCQSLAECERSWAQSLWAVADPLAWVRRLEQQGVDLPHDWRLTSDAIAAAIAGELDAQSLVMLKSADLPVDVHTPQEASGLGLVDPCFPGLCRTLKQIQWLNLRETPLIARAMTKR